MKEILTNLLTINGVFSAILITYLFSRITWTKDRKLESYKKAISISQKITDFRRILNILTSYYDVWNTDKETKLLLESGKFSHINFYEYRLTMTSNYKGPNAKLIDELSRHTDFSEGRTTLYLAIASLVKKRDSNFQLNRELYKDFQHNNIYNSKIVEQWLYCGIMDSIRYWFEKKTNYINYLALKKDKVEIMAAATRINNKYKNYELENKLLEELADDMCSHYLPELNSCLLSLKKGIQNLNLIIITLISLSLFFGVLLPFILLLICSTAPWYGNAVGIIASINAGLIGYFIIIFPFLINKELKWV